MEISVKLEGVTKRHGQVLAVDRVSLEIRRGEFFSILGPSGSGKSTILRLIAGLDFPDEGRISILQTLVNDQPPDKRPVNLVFQHYALFPHLSVFENVAFGLKMRRESPQRIQEAVSSILALVRLQGKEQRFPNDLSGGEQQRVALARALVNRPVVLLLDEPLAALDQQLRQEMQSELKRLQREVQSTFICVTHQQDEALTMSDRLAVISAGKILQIGTPQEIYHSPNSKTVATFIGRSNTVEGIVETQEGEVFWVRHPGLPLIQVRHSLCPPTSDPVTVLVRPERLTVAVGSGGQRFDNSLPGELVNVMFNGDEVLYQVRLGTGLVWLVRLPSMVCNGQSLAVGQQVLVQWDAHDGLILPARSS